MFERLAFDYQPKNSIILLNLSISSESNKASMQPLKNSVEKHFDLQNHRTELASGSALRAIQKSEKPPQKAAKIDTVPKKVEGVR